MKLFYRKPELIKIAGKKMPDDVSKWSETILKEITSEVPFLSDIISHINMKKVDEKSGYGVGNVVVKTGSKQSVIPFTVRDFELDPMDVFFADGEYYPLTESTFQRVTFNPEIGSIDKKEDKSSIDRAISGQNIDEIKDIPSFLKTSSILDNISDTIKSDDLKSFKQSLNDEGMMTSLHDNPVSDTVSKILDYQPMQEKTLIEKVSEITRPEIVRVLKSDDGTFSIESTPLKYYHSITKTGLDKEAAEKIIENIGASPELIKQAQAAGEAVQSPYPQDAGKAAPSGPAGPSAPVSQPTPNAPQQATPVAQEDVVNEAGQPQKPFGYYICQQPNGAMVKGWIIPTVHDLNMEQTENMLFTNGEVSAFQPSIACQPTEPDAEMPVVDLSQGTVSLFAQSEQAAFATTPIDIMSTSQMPNGTSIRGQDMEGNKINLIPTEGANSIVQVNLDDIAGNDQSGLFITDGINYYIPMNMQAIKIGQMTELTSDQNTMQKTSFPIFYNKIRVISLGSDEYSLKGKPIEKLSSMRDEDYERLSHSDARYNLMMCGVPYSRADGFLKRASVRSQRDINIIGTSGIKTFKDIAHTVPLDYSPINKVSKMIDSMKGNLTKVAAAISNESVADKVLSLNFINPDNLKIFVDYLPEFQDTSQKLSKLLLASRIGLTAVDENSIKVAMEKLDEVSTQLQIIKQTIE